MREETWLEELRESMKQFAKDPGDMFQRLIDAGIIDQQGRVLKRMPAGPPWLEKPKRKKSAKRPPASNGQDDQAAG